MILPYYYFTRNCTVSFYSINSVIVIIKQEAYDRRGIPDNGTASWSNQRICYQLAPPNSGFLLILILWQLTDQQNHKMQPMECCPNFGILLLNTEEGTPHLKVYLRLTLSYLPGRAL